MGDGPAERDVELEQFSQFVRCLLGIGVSPGAEPGQKLPFLVKRHVAVHHGADADGAHGGQVDAVLLFDCVPHSCVAAPETLVDLFQRISPDPVFQRILPVIKTDCKHFTFQVRKDSLDPGGAEFDPQCCLPGFDIRILRHFSYLMKNFCRSASVVSSPMVMSSVPVRRANIAMSALVRAVETTEWCAPPA